MVKVTLLSTSRQEAAEGEPVRRHAAQLTQDYRSRNKDVFTIFIASTVNTNTAETLRIGSWYLPDDTRIGVQVIPLSILQFHQLIKSRISRQADIGPAFWESLFLRCLSYSNLDAPAWKNKINQILQDAA
jgi:hypothetical protein